MIEFVAHQVVAVLKEEVKQYHDELNIKQLPDNWLTVSNDSQNAIVFNLNNDTAYFKISVDWKANKYQLQIVLLNNEINLKSDDVGCYNTVLEAMNHIASTIAHLIEININPED